MSDNIGKEMADCFDKIIEPKPIAEYPDVQRLIIQVETLSREKQEGCEIIKELVRCSDQFQAENERLKAILKIMQTVLNNLATIPPISDKGISYLASINKSVNEALKGHDQ